MAKNTATHSVCEVVVKANNKRFPDPFPLDMLRYDSCVPATEQDANTIKATIADSGVPMPEAWTGHVVLRRFYQGAAHERTNMNMARWRTYGWDVIRVYLPGEVHEPIPRHTT